MLSMVLGVLSTLLRAHVIVQGYNWYLLPLGGGMPELSIVVVIGIIYTVSLFFQSDSVTLYSILSSTVEDSSSNHSVLGRVILNLLLTLVTWLLLWIFHFFL